ncbi:hypothetical protein EBN03_21010 [Nocardia stercoris]|uniref:Uncharacterized protein n=1 Tax=Nocardia stercoris TaxID=2483361 RepID=A0A3M2L812_9NOCA|nr:hypothetical protein EBN03_21010 [Nocardia stercoris]
MAPSAATLITAYGAGSQPVSVNPKIPTVREATKPAIAPPASPAATTRSVQGAPTSTRNATAKDAAASSRNDGPITWMYRYPAR